jgi:membrane associated rhomboid family serine protease
MRPCMRTALRIACWFLIVVGALAIALFVAVFFTTDDSSARFGLVLFVVITLAVMAGAVYGLRRRPKPAGAVEPPSESAIAAHEALRTGEPIVLTPSRRRWSFVLLVSVLLAAGSAWVMIEAPNVIAALGVLLFGPGTIISVLQMIPGRAYLRIARDGLLVRGPFKTTRWDWNDIEDFEAYAIQQRYSSSKHVGFDRRDVTPERQSFWTTLSRGMTGVDVALPDTYGMRHHELAALLNDARDTYATEHGPSPSALADRRLQREAARVPHDRVPAVTVVVSVACVVAFVVEVSRFGLFPSAPELLDAGGASRDALADGRVWTLLSANLLHANVFHIFFNLAAFLIIGLLLEREVGWTRMAIVCVAGGVAAMGLAVVQSGAIVVGLSGVVFAISGWAVLRDTHSTRALGAVAWATLPIGVIYTFLTPHVSIGAHVGGLLAGLAVGHAFERAMKRGGITGAPAASL